MSIDIDSIKRAIAILQAQPVPESRRDLWISPETLARWRWGAAYRAWRIELRQWPRLTDYPYLHLITLKAMTPRQILQRYEPTPIGGQIGAYGGITFHVNEYVPRGEVWAIGQTAARLMNVGPVAPELSEPGPRSLADMFIRKQAE